MLPLAFLVLVFLLYAGGEWGRRRCGQPVTSAFRTQLAILVGGTGTALLGAAVPVYVIVRRGIYGGAISENLPVGISEDILLNLVIIGVVITVVVAVGRYLEHIQKE